jgi:hypothetical protein
MIDLGILIQQTSSLLIPALPYLLDAGHGAAKKLGEAAGGTVSEAARSIWAWLRPKAASGRPELLEAAEDVAKEINDLDAHAAFRQQLRKMLDGDPALQEELQKLVIAADSPSTKVTVSGTGAVGVGGNVSGTTITTNVNKTR